MKNPEISDLPQLPESVADSALGVERKSDGTFATKEAARAAGRRGGLAKSRRRREFGIIGLESAADHPKLGKHWDRALKWLEAETQDLSLQCDGFIGPGPMQQLKMSAISMAAAFWCFEMVAETDSPVLLDKYKILQQSWRENWAQAKKEAIEDAKRRKAASSNDPYAAFRNIVAEDDED